ncbi:MAG: NAD-dependent epimerase/dehydratase family protein, partial [Euryarchaeota archaeon]|nr:NAD-dependent epimerase/dehydratase family protein [Euryarchaeota archaeon]
MSDLVLVTGASGFIGSHIVANLLSRGKNVR